MFRHAPFIAALLGALHASPVEAGLRTAPRDSYQVWFPAEWYISQDGEVVPQEDPGRCAIALLDPLVVTEGGLTDTIREVIKERRGGTVMATERFTAFGGRTGLVIYSVRLRGSGVYSMAWAAVPLDGGRYSLVVLRSDGSAIQGAYKDQFLEIAGTAAPFGIWEDVPREDLQGVWDRKAASVTVPVGTTAPGP